MIMRALTNQLVWLLVYYYIAGVDYTILTDPDSPLTLSTQRPNATIAISIDDDNIFEPAESFEIVLYFKDQINVALEPRAAIITIRAQGIHVLTVAGFHAWDVVIIMH